MIKNILRPWLELARISNLPTVWTNILAAWLLAGGKWEWKPLAWLLFGGSLIYTGGMFLNDAADVKFDRDHRKERPIPSGRISLAKAWIAGISFIAGGFAMFVWGAEACIWLTGALVAAIIFYDLYHKPWPGSVLIMGSCRTLLYFATASAVTGALHWSDNRLVMTNVSLKAIMLGFYIVGVSNVARRESTGQARVNSVGLAFLLPVISRSPINRDSGMLVGTTWDWWLLATIYSAFIIHAILPMRKPPPANIGRAVGRLLAGIVLVDALAVYSVSPSTAWCFAASLPLLILWQRKIAAT